MKNDPLVEETRQAGQAYINSFNGDWKAITADLNRRAREEKRKVISRPAKRIETPPHKKKAG